MLLLLVACKGPATVSTPPVDDTGDVPTDQPTPTEPPLPDADGDGVEDDVDNCPHAPNEDQADLDFDGEGDLCDPDIDGDLIPQPADIFPLDPERPGRAINERVYAHTAGDIYTFDVYSHATELIGSPGVGTLTDLAIDRYGVLWVATFSALYICHPETMECWEQGTFQRSVNGLTFVPPDDLDALEDRLVIIAIDGSWATVERQPGGGVQFVPAGGYGGGLTSSGDVFSIVGTGTYAAVTGPGGELIVAVDPSDGSVVSTVATVPPVGIWGLAGWDGVIFAFASNGQVFQLDPAGGTAVPVVELPLSWYGAGVVTQIPQLP